MKDLPLQSSASFSKGIWFVHRDDDVIIRAWGSTMSGAEKIYINDDLVSTKTVITKFTSIHRTKYGGRNYEVELTVTSYQMLEIECNMFRDGQLLNSFLSGYTKTGELYVKEKRDTDAAIARAIERFRKEGIKKLKEYEVDESIEEFQMALTVEPEDAEAHFYLACGFSLLEEKEKGFQHLKEAINAGLKGKDRILNIDQLAYLRIQPEFEAFKQEYL